MIIGRCQRSNDIIEPLLKTQWFIRDVAPGRAGAGGHPDRPDADPARPVRQGLGALADQDPRLERQPAAVVGHRIPAWYCPDGHISVTDDPAGPSACEACGRPAAELDQDPDIFDTWFSSGLWPFSTLGWPDDTPDLRRFYPDVVWRPATTSSSSGSPG